MNFEQELIERLNPADPVEPLSADEIQQKWNDIESIMKELRLTGKIIRAVPSPNVLRFEIEAETDQGGSISPAYHTLCKQTKKKFCSKLRVTRKGYSLSLEIPNDRQQFVPARQLFESERWKNTTMELPVALGIGDHYATVMFDLVEAHHCLIAGGIGAGKKSCTQMLLASLMLKHSPEEVKFALFNLKFLPFSQYSESPYLLHPMITDYQETPMGLETLVVEMERRLQLLAEADCRKLSDYNQSGKGQLPYIVVVLDDLCDFFVAKEWQKSLQAIVNLVAKGQDAGIHLIASTSRTAPNALANAIKKVFPTKFVFQTAFSGDSHLIAEKLLGKGDMLFIQKDQSITRLQGGFLEDEENVRLLDGICDAYGTGNSKQPLSEQPAEEPAAVLPRLKITKELRAMVEQVVQALLPSEIVSIARVQRALRIGYHRAEYLLIILEQRGIISQQSVQGTRSFLVSSLEEAKRKLQG